MISIRMQQSSKWKKAKKYVRQIASARIYSSPFYQAYLSPALFACKGTVYAGSLPAVPLLNSNYDASFIAGILQLRYIYSMPVNVFKLFAEHGFEMNKATAHGLIKKAAGLFDLVEDVLKETVLSDNYLSMDESYYTVLTSDTNNHPANPQPKDIFGQHWLII